MRDLYSIILREALLEVSVEQLKQQFVDSGKISDKVFEEIITSSGGKSAYVTWLVKKVVDKIIKEEDVYKYKNYINTFERNKNKYLYKDINQYKTSEDVSKFINTSLEIIGREKEDPSSIKGIDKKSKYKEFELGNVDGFDVYEIPKDRKDLYGMSCELGSGTEWCTATGKTKDYFESYISKGPLYIFIKGDEKYQFSFVADQYMDGKDERINIKDYKNFFEFLNKKGANLPLKIKLLLKLVLTKEDLHVEGSFFLEEEDGVSELPDNLWVGGDLYIQSSEIRELPNNLHVEEDLSTSNIKKIGNTLFVKGFAGLRHSSFSKLPDDVFLGGNVDLYDSKIIELPDSLKHIHGFLNLNDSEIEKLPNGMTIRGDLCLYRTKIKSLPDDLKVGGHVILTGSKIENLPKNLYIGEDLHLIYTPISKKYSKEEIRKICPGIKGEIILGENNFFTPVSRRKINEDLYSIILREALEKDSLQDLKKHIAACIKLAEEKGWNVKPYPKVVFSNEDESNTITGKTGYYNPDTKAITLFWKGRSQKDVLNTFTHELRHYHQDQSGKLKDKGLSDSYTNGGKDLKEIEDDAYVNGNILRREYTEMLQSKS